MILMLRVLLGGWLLSLMSGLMAAWWRIRSQVPVVLPIAAVVFGRIGGGGHLDEDVGDDAVVSTCRGFCSVPVPLQSVQRAEFWCVILALQANDGVHLGVDNLGVVRHVGRLLDGKTASRPAELVKDGDLILLIERMPRLRGLDTVRISKS